MIRLFYEPETGKITHWMTAKFAVTEGTWLDVPQRINIKLWRVNPHTLELIPVQAE